MGEGEKIAKGGSRFSPLQKKKISQNKALRDHRRRRRLPGGMERKGGRALKEKKEDSQSFYPSEKSPNTQQKGKGRTT